MKHIGVEWFKWRIKIVKLNKVKSRNTFIRIWTPELHSYFFMRNFFSTIKTIKQRETEKLKNTFGRSLPRQSWEKYRKMRRKMCSEKMKKKNKKEYTGKRDHRWNVSQSDLWIFLIFQFFLGFFDRETADSPLGVLRADGDFYDFTLSSPFAQRTLVGFHTYGVLGWRRRRISLIDLMWLSRQFSYIEVFSWRDIPIPGNWY